MRSMMIEVEARGGVVVRWSNGLVLLADPTGAWFVLAGYVLAHVTAGQGVSSYP
jgi:hypothetical protein